MTKKQIILANAAILGIGYVVPLVVFNRTQDNLDIQTTQKALFIWLLVSAFILYYLNHRFKQLSNYRAWSIFFRGLGMLGILYAGGALFLLTTVRNGIGF